MTVSSANATSLSSSSPAPAASWPSTSSAPAAVAALALAVVVLSLAFDLFTTAAASGSAVPTPLSEGRHWTVRDDAVVSLDEASGLSIEDQERNVLYGLEGTVYNRWMDKWALIVCAALGLTVAGSFDWSVKAGGPWMVGPCFALQTSDH